MDNTQDELWAHATCETCGVDMCDCGAKCPRRAIEATPETYPGWRRMEGVRVCVECAPQWLPEQADLALASGGVA